MSRDLQSVKFNAWYGRVGEGDFKHLTGTNQTREAARMAFNAGVSAAVELMEEIKSECFALLEPQNPQPKPVKADVPRAKEGSVVDMLQ